MILGPSKKEWSIETSFPDNGKMAVLFSGGMDSTLIASIAIDLYGKDNVFLIWSDAMFCGNDSRTNKVIKYNVETVADYLGMRTFYVPIDYDYFKINPLLSQRDAWIDTQKALNADYISMGLTAMLWDIIPLREMTRTEILNYCNSDRKKHKALIEQYYMDTDTYTGDVQTKLHSDVCAWLEENIDKQFHFPLGKLYKEEIVDLYYKLGKEDILYNTISCTKGSGNHCGECWSCQNRYDGHVINNLSDKTEYKSNLIKERRNKLK